MKVLITDEQSLFRDGLSLRLKEIKEDIASIAVDIAEKVIEKDLTEKDHERLLEEFLEGSGEAKWNLRQ